MLKIDWLKQFSPYENGILIDDIIARVMRKLNTKQFTTFFTRWIQAVTKATDGDVIAINGKTLRCSFNTSDEKLAIHIVST